MAPKRTTEKEQLLVHVHSWVQKGATELPPEDVPPEID
jgi:hypothetical protein